MSIQDLIQLINTQLPDNNQRLITEAILRGVLENIVNTLSSELRVFNINSSQVTDNQDSTYSITGVENALVNAIAIDEKLNIFQFDGTNWVAKVVDIILSATGDDGVEIDDSDPNSIVVKLTQATLNSLDYVDEISQYLTVDENQILSTRGANEISDPDSDIILSSDNSQPNRILGQSTLRNIIGGYDNTINDNIASSIFGSHHSIIAGGGHNLIAGGSTHIINDSSYSSIIGGRNITVNGVNVHFLGGCEHAEIHGGGSFGAICARNFTVDPSFTGSYTFIGPSSGAIIAASASNYNSIIGGVDHVIGGTYGFIGQGATNEVSGTRSTVINGRNNTASGDGSIVLNGIGNTAPSWGEVVCGVYATEYTPNSTTGFADDRIFAIGIGPNSSLRRNAYSAYKNGRNQFRFINIEQITPGTKIDGDIWFDGTDLKMRVGGVDKTFTLT